MLHRDSVRQFWSQWRFTGLLTALIVLNLGRLATASLVVDRFALDILGSIFLIFATLSLCVEKRSRAVALTLGIPATILCLVGITQSGRTESLMLLAGRGVSICFLTFAIGVILRTLMTQPTVTRDSIAGAFCGYVLIGLAFAEAYCLVEAVIPDSFQLSAEKPDWLRNPLQRWLTLQYFSFTTLTTLGFGDVLPVSPLARGLAIWEAVSGQFYLAVLVAGLVNLRASRPAASHESDTVGK